MRVVQSNDVSPWLVGSGNQNCAATTGKEEFQEEPEGNPTMATGYEQTPPHDHGRTWHANVHACAIEQGELDTSWALKPIPWYYRGERKYILDL